MIIRFQNIVKEVEAKREYFDYHEKRELEEHLLVKLRSYVLGMSNLFKYRLKIWSSGVISPVVGVQICPLSELDRWVNKNRTFLKP